VRYDKIFGLVCGIGRGFCYLQSKSAKRMRK